MSERAFGPGDGGCGADDGRTAAYAAEEAALGGTDAEDGQPIAALIEAADALTNGEWWHAAGGPRVAVAAAAAGTASSSARATTTPGARVVVRVAAAQCTKATLAHELAHALAGVEHGHDAVFRAALVDVCALMIGRDGARRLASAYADLGVPPGRRQWPSPVRVTGVGFAVVP